MYLLIQCSEHTTIISRALAPSSRLGLELACTSQVGCKTDGTACLTGGSTELKCVEPLELFAVDSTGTVQRT